MSKNFAENIEVRYGTGSFIDLNEVEMMEKVGEGGIASNCARDDDSL